MSYKITNIAKNTSYFTIALIIQKMITFSYFVLLARNLMPEDLGKYYFAISFTTIFAIFIDIGLSNVLTREVARNKDRAGKLLGNVLAIKIPLAIIALLATLAVINLLNYPQLTKTLVYISCISMVFDSFTATFFSIIRGFHILAFESISSIIFSSIALFFGFIVIKLNLGLKWQMGALALASAYNFLFSFYLVFFKFKVSISKQFDKKLIKTIIAITIPFALYGIFQRLFTYLDSVFLSIFAGDGYVGIYQVAFKIIFALQFLPLAFMASVYPAFSSYFSKNKEQLVITFERAIAYLSIISMPICFGMIAISDKVIGIFKPEYASATVALNIIMVAVIFIFLDFPIGALLNACNRQRRNTINMGFTLVFSIILNLILIPKFNVIGASITVVAANLFEVILDASVVPQIIKVRLWKIFNIFFKALFSAAIMFIYAFSLKSYLTLFILIPSAGCLYFFILLLTGAIKKEDFISIANSFINKKTEGSLE